MLNLKIKILIIFFSLFFSQFAYAAFMPADIVAIEDNFIIVESNYFQTGTINVFLKLKDHPNVSFLLFSKKIILKLSEKADKVQLKLEVPDNVNLSAFDPSVEVSVSDTDIIPPVVYWKGFLGQENIVGEFLSQGREGKYFSPGFVVFLESEEGKSKKTFFSEIKANYDDSELKLIQQNQTLESYQFYIKWGSWSQAIKKKLSGYVFNKDTSICIKGFVYDYKLQNRFYSTKKCFPLIVFSRYLTGDQSSLFLPGEIKSLVYKQYGNNKDVYMFPIDKTSFGNVNFAINIIDSLKRDTFLRPAGSVGGVLAYLKKEGLSPKSKVEAIGYFDTVTVVDKKKAIQVLRIKDRDSFKKQILSKFLTANPNDLVCVAGWTQGKDLVRFFTDSICYEYKALK